MAAHNILKAEIICPHCSNVSFPEIEFRFGLRDMTVYHLGDSLVWEKKDSLKYSNEIYIGEGYVECPICHKDYWVKILVNKSIISEVKIDFSRKGYIP